MSAFFNSVFTSKTGLQKSHVPETRKKVWSKEDVCLVEEDLVREYLNTLDLSPWALMGCICEC